MLSKVAAFRELVESQNPTAPIRKAITDTEAVELIGELTAAGGPGLPQHPDAVLPAAADLAVVLGQTIPTDPDQLQSWAERKGAASRALWDAFQGSVVDGVEIIRKRPL